MSLFLVGCIDLPKRTQKDPKEPIWAKNELNYDVSVYYDATVGTSASCDKICMYVTIIKINYEIVWF